MKNFQQTGLILALIFAVYLSFFSHASAIESTPSSEVKTKLDQLKQDIASKAAKIKKDISKKLQDRVYFGVISELTPTSLELITKSDSRRINLNQDTVYENANAKVVKFSSIKKEATIAALGDIDETGAMVAKKVVLLTATQPKVQLKGRVLSITKKNITITSTEASGSAILFDTKTAVQKSGVGATTSVIKKDDSVIISGYLAKNGLTANLIYIIPNSDATHSASPSASPKAR